MGDLKSLSDFPAGLIQAILQAPFSSLLILIGLILLLFGYSNAYPEPDVINQGFKRIGDAGLFSTFIGILMRKYESDAKEELEKKKKSKLKKQLQSLIELPGNQPAFFDPTLENFDMWKKDSTLFIEKNFGEQKKLEFLSEGTPALGLSFEPIPEAVRLKQKTEEMKNETKKKQNFLKAIQNNID